MAGTGLIARLAALRQVLRRVTALEDSAVRLDAGAAAQAADIRALRQELDTLRSGLTEAKDALARLQTDQYALKNAIPPPTALNLEALTGSPDPAATAWARRGPMLLMLRHAPAFLGQNARVGPHLAAVDDGAITMLAVKTYGKMGPPVRNDLTPHLLAELRKHLPAAAAFETDIPRTEPAPETYDRAEAERLYQLTGKWMEEDPHLVDFVAAAYANLPSLPQPAISVAPFDAPERLRTTMSAEPRRRSALFLHNSYYHFNHLAAGLRARGWDALSVSLEDPASAQRQFFHGEDLTLFDPDYRVMREKIRAFSQTVPERFGALHFYGMGQASLFPEHFENVVRPTRPSFDFHELRRHGVIIGYMPSGCLDGAPQSAINAAAAVCGKCVWQDQPDVCSDARNLAWAERLEQLCDWVGLEGDWAVGPRTGDRFVRGPVVTALDPDLWRPNLEIPEPLRIEKAPGEVVIYHAVGNYELRRARGRDIKGTGAVIAAVEKLQAEGHRVRLHFAHDIPSRQVRFVQVQADIVVDQLNYGRYGANAREALMLGRPLAVRLNPDDPGLAPERSLEEVPAVDANEASVADVLRRLVLDEPLRQDLSRRARAFAVAWHGKDACALRYERVIERLRAGLRPDSPDLYPHPGQT